MPKIVTDYFVASAHNIRELEALVQSKLKEGWQPHGSLVLGTPIVNEDVAPIFLQSMIKETNSVG